MFWTASRYLPYKVSAMYLPLSWRSLTCVCSIVHSAKQPHWFYRCLTALFYVSFSFIYPCLYTCNMCNIDISLRTYGINNCRISTTLYWFKEFFSHLNGNICILFVHYKMVLLNFIVMCNEKNPKTPCSIRNQICSEVMKETGNCELNRSLEKYWIKEDQAYRKI